MNASNRGRRLGRQVQAVRPKLRAGHVARDFNTLDDLIQHARTDLGATHVTVAGPDTRIYFPRGGQYPYEEARVWRKGGYWHAEGPGARRGTQLPRGAKPILSRSDPRHQAAEAVPPPRRERSNPLPSQFPSHWRGIPPGAENARAIGCRDAKAGVWYFPYGDTVYDVSGRSVATIDLCFDSLEEARRFYDTVVASGDVEAAELRVADGKSPQGRLIDIFPEENAGAYEATHRRGASVREDGGDEERGAAYARDQIDGEYFRQWVWEQMSDASKMDPSKVMPLESDADYRELARRMLQQLEWDVKRDLPESREFFVGFKKALQNKDVVNWLVDELKGMNEQIRPNKGRKSGSRVRESVAKRFRVGSRVVMNDDALSNYGQRWQGIVFVVTSVSDKYMPSKDFFSKGRPSGYHPGYDEGAGSALYDLSIETTGETFNSSLYDWELESAPGSMKPRRRPARRR